MPLNDTQKLFLKKFLNARPSTKGQLGGRQLAKIKGEYEKFCKERQKVDELLSKLRGMPRGDVLASSHEQVLKGISDRVDIASATGDETVFKPAYKELEQTRKNLEEDIERRKKDIKATDERAKKYEKELASAQKESNPTKKTEKLKSLKESIYAFLKDDHRGLDTAPVWAVCEKVIAAMGGPQKEDLSTIANELDSYTWNLGKDIRKAEDDGIDPIVYNTAYQYDTKVHQLRADLDKYIKAAENIGDVINLKRLQRLKEESTRLLVIVDPPALPIAPTQQQPQQPNQSQQPPKQPEKKEEKKQLTEEEVKTNSLKKADSLLDKFETDYARIKKNYENFSGQVSGLKNKVNPAKAQLEVDLKMIDTAVADAKLKLEAGEKQLNIAKSERQLIKDGKGDWKDHLQKISEALEIGAGEFQSGERLIGQMEGGLLHIARSFESIQNLTQRIRNVDEALLDTILAKLPLLPQCSNNFTKLDPDELEMLKQLAFVSAMDNQKLTTALGTATDRNNLDKVIKLLIEKPKHSTEELTSLMAQSQQICIDVDRFYGGQGKFVGSLQQADKDKYKKIQDLAKQDVAKYTIPVIRPRKKVPQGSKLTSVGVAVVGGGPIGLMAAVEARMSGASQVHVYEGRKDAYSRMNVLKIDKPQLQRFRSAGIFDAIFPNGQDPNSEALASVKTIEIALEGRCGALGIQLEREKTLTDVSRDDKGVCHLIFKGEENNPKTCDLLIVAVGAGIAPAQKNANTVALGDTLGVPFQQSEIKDFATVGLFNKNVPQRKGVTENVDGWVYNFETEEVKYVVAQLTEEEYKAYTDNPSALRDRVIQEAQRVKMIDRPNGNPKQPRVSTASKAETIEDKGKNLEDAVTLAWPKLLKEVTGEDRFFGSKGVDSDDAFKKGKERAIRILKKTLAEKKKEKKTEKLSEADVEAAVMTCINMEMGITEFEMNFQQAQQFKTKGNAGVLVGDSAATPHPSTSKGLNTGVDEMGSIRDLVEDIQFGEGKEENREEALKMYEWELKRRTDYLVSQALDALQIGGRERCNSLGKKLAALTKSAGVQPEKFSDPIKEHNRALSVAIDSPEAKNDHDWKKREAAIKNIRAFEKQIQGVVTQVENILQNNPSAGKDELMAPFELLFPKKV